ncbi:SBBP repeat-containing protein [Aeoliella sp. SH292]|uniref:SBBP repeat-containing protein n=1 Tax=Aeoliella sp. SH292 TaxID=3454464 RepID=UPI003F9B0672
MKRCMFLLLFAHCWTPLLAATHEWTRQLGTSDLDAGSGVSSDGLGNLYITGSTGGALGGAHVGRTDAFLVKYDSGGALLWTRQVATAADDESLGVSADRLGNVYIAGRTNHDLGGTSAGLTDAFLSKYNSEGASLWTRQLGTATYDDGFGVSVDGLGSVYISGRTMGDLGGGNRGSWDAFLSKYDSTGELKWTRQLGSVGSDDGKSISADAFGNVYVTGSTGGSIGEANAGQSDAFVSQYDSDGGLNWTRQVGTGFADYSLGISADGLGNVYFTGRTEGALNGANAGGSDAFVGKFDAVGNLLWVQQFGTANDDLSFGVSADTLGNVYVTGRTEGALSGEAAGGFDAFVRKYDATGMHLWTEQFGTAFEDDSRSIIADGLGNLYLTGRTYGNLGGANAGAADVYVAKYADPVPEPTTATFGIIVSLGLVSTERLCKAKGRPVPLLR